MSFVRHFRPFAQRIRVSRNLSTTAHRRHAAIPYTATCPSPTCTCASTPPDLDIDRKAPLMNTMATYSEQVVICTGKDDWSSRIEDEQSDSGDFVRGLKSVIGKGGPGFDPFNNVMVTASSFPLSTAPASTTALLFPAFKRISALPHSPTAFSEFATAYLKARELHAMHDALSDSQKADLMRDESVASNLPPAEDIDKVTVLICGHGGRDERCGILGPVLRDGFQEEFRRRGVDADVGLISHIGGHKYAGNVIIYIPPNLQRNALKGMGVWYGRIGPENVEGVVEETVVGGRVIADLFRGGITKEGASLGRMLEEQMKKDGGEGAETLKLKPRARR